jgi:phage terminase large subunit-like protein
MKRVNGKEIADWEHYVRNLMSATPAPVESQQERIARIARLKTDFAAWAKFYFPKFCDADFADFHLEFVNEVVANERCYCVRALAREHAKSVVSGLFLPLFLMANNKMKNMILISNSEDKAIDLLTPLKIALESNQRLLNDYGEQVGWQWEKGKFVTKNGISFRALGAGQSPRGSRNEEARPDYIVIDDIDTDTESRNQRRIDEKYEWIERALIPAMSLCGTARLVAVGNIISKESCIVKMSRFATSYRVVNILDNDGKPSWHQRYTLANVNEMLAKMTYRSAQAEYFNNPISTGLIFNDLQFGEIPNLGEFQHLVCYTDPSWTSSKKADYKATVLIGNIGTKFYVVKAYCEQTTTAEMIDWQYRIQSFVGDATAVYYHIEGNMNQETLWRPKLDERIASGDIISISSDTRQKPDKFSRIESVLEPLHRTQNLILQKKKIRT